VILVAVGMGKAKKDLGCLSSLWSFSGMLIAKEYSSKVFDGFPLQGADCSGVGRYAHEPAKEFHHHSK